MSSDANKPERSTNFGEPSNGEPSNGEPSLVLGDSGQLNDDSDDSPNLPATDDTSETVAMPVPRDGELQPGDLIGRYEFVRELGRGGFGFVVEARDNRLNRTVAIKFPRIEKFEDHALAFLEEARSVARLDHTSIIRIYNVEQREDGLPFVVMEYVEGPTLAHVIRNEGLTYAQAVRYLIQLAQALDYAHRQTLIHRDIKPANVIISSKDDTAKLADFGMALHDLTPEENLADCPQGTPPYMAPEQVRGENHRLDRRTDVWGFGVLMYVVLTGEKPFEGRDLVQLVQQICLQDPPPLSEINENIPRELERICLRCLEKLMRNRYQETSKLVEDLKAFEKSSNWQNDETFSSTKIQWLDSAVGSVSNRRFQRHTDGKPSDTADSDSLSSFRVVPKGLRSFDTQDVEFFLNLLPGPKDRMGVPDSIRFWMNQLNPGATDPLTVGMIYGPSGCGKSSFVKAGLIPLLDESIRTVYLEASPENTEADLLAKIEAIAPNVVRDETELPVVLSRIRRGQMMTGEKLLIVLDQFEQWLSVQSELARQPLVESLRQCDGENLCCLLLIRDDFWMSASQFMNRLDLRVQEGNNALGIPLFDRRHARNVLAGYGRALQALPAYGQPLDANQRKFVELSIDQMADQGKVVPIHIAMFAQMVDPESWHLTELKKKGGWQGIGIRFLNKIFSDKRLANSESICRELLAQLLPESDSEIKGAEKSLSQLMPADASERFKSRLLRVLDLLDREFRVITPTEVDESERHYQLAHDSLVIPIRTWLAQKEAQTWQGRSRARITPLIAQWNERPENRFLPSLLELIPIKLGVKRSSLTDSESSYLASATRYYAVRGAIVAILAMILLVGANWVWRNSTYQRAREHYANLLRAHSGEVGVRLQMLERYPAHHRARLMSGELDKDWSNSRNLYGLFARAYFAESAEEFPAQQLIAAVRVIGAEESENLIRLLKAHGQGQALEAEMAQQLETAFESADSLDEKIRYAIVSMHVVGPKRVSQLVRFEDDPEHRERLIEIYSLWHGPLSDAIELMDGSSDESLVSALGKSFGLMKKSQMAATEYQKFIAVQRKLYQDSSSPAVHSTSEWVLRRFDEGLPGIAIPREGGRWFVDRLSDGNELTFVQVKPHDVYVGNPPEGKSKPSQKPLTQGFYVSTKEVSLSLFQRYFQESVSEHLPVIQVPTTVPSLTQIVLPSPAFQFFHSDPLSQLSEYDLPVCDVTWNEAVGFCNWLSRREGKRPSYEFDSKHGRWVPAKNRNGYRLPTNLEFDAFNRAGTSSMYFFGSTMKRVPQYACAGTPDLPFSGVYVDFRGKRMPNNFGVFDSTGNTAEWCEDSDHENGVFHFVRGSATIYPLYYLESSQAISYNPTDARGDSGIRLVIDLPNEVRVP